MKAKEIILLILIIAAGIIFYHAQTGKIWFDWEWEEGIYFGQEEFVYEVTEEITPPLPGILHIVNAHGNVEVQGTQQDTISITFEKQIYRRKRNQADEVAEKLEMIIQKNGESIQISTNREDFRKRNFRTNFKIYLPESMELRVKNSYGVVDASHVGDTEIANRNGKVYVSEIAGNLMIENSYKEVEVENVQSDCQIQSRSSSVRVTDVEGYLRITHRYGKIHLEDIGEAVTVEGSNSEVYGQSIAGLSDIQTSYRKVNLYDVGQVKIRASNSRIEIDGAKDSVDVEDRYGKVDLTDIQGNLRVDGKNLEISGKSVVGKSIYISTSYRKIDLTEFQGKTEISNSNGDVYLYPLPLTHPIQVIGRYTDIKFYWPSGGKYPIEAKAKGGNIDWDLSTGLSFEEENGYSIIKAFVEEQDKPSIFLSTTYGSIKIEEFSILPEQQE
ncbi:MAG: hypothetical protein OEV50_02390 [Candidatus Aminicenantes bacterium]|nr:hypothetical protein [Candidatus Aminicenantes bacterium]